MSVGSQTPLQAALVALAALLADARDTLDDDAYQALVLIACLVVENEARRLALGEALRAIRGTDR